MNPKVGKEMETLQHYFNDTVFVKSNSSEGQTTFFVSNQFRNTVNLLSIGPNVSESTTEVKSIK